MYDRRTLLRAGTAALGLAAGTGISVAQSPSSRPLQAVEPGPITVLAEPLGTFERANPGKRKFGALEFRGGLVLTSPSPAIGGWSGLALSADGRRLLAVCDEGAWLTGEIVYEGLAPHALRNCRLGPLIGPGGHPVDRKGDADAESVTLLDGSLSGGNVLVAFEQNHRIVRCPVDEQGLAAPTGALRLPPDVRRMRRNVGFESVGVIRGGRMKGAIVAFAEELYDARRNHTGWLWPGGFADAPQMLNLVNIADFAVTDVSSLPDGDLIVLERKFRWTQGVKMRLRRIAADSVRPGALLDGPVLLEANMAYEIDNMEGLGLHTNARGETILTLISDDNFNHFLQRTLLLQFALAQA